MATVRVHHAIGAEPATIVIGDQLQELSPARQVGGYRAEAALLAQTLHDALPGGTLDQLLIALLNMQASRLGVRHQRHS